MNAFSNQFVIGTVVGDQRFVVRKRYSLKIFEQVVTVRSSRPEVFVRKGVLKICRKFTGEHPCRSPISINLLCNPIEIALRHGCSPVNQLCIFRKLFLRNTSGCLLLYCCLLKKIKLHLKSIVLKSLYNKIACLRACNFFAKTVNSFQLITIFTKSFIVDIQHDSKYVSESQTQHLLLQYRCVQRPK